MILICFPGKLKFGYVARNTRSSEAVFTAYAVDAPADQSGSLGSDAVEINSDNDFEEEARNVARVVSPPDAHTTLFVHFDSLKKKRPSAIRHLEKCVIFCVF